MANNHNNNEADSEFMSRLLQESFGGSQGQVAEGINTAKASSNYANSYDAGSMWGTNSDWDFAGSNQQALQAIREEIKASCRAHAAEQEAQIAAELKRQQEQQTRLLYGVGADTPVSGEADDAAAAVAAAATAADATSNKSNTLLASDILMRRHLKVARHDNLGVSMDSSAEYKENVRAALVRDFYIPQDIYQDDRLLEPVDPILRQSPESRSGFFGEAMVFGEGTLREVVVTAYNSTLVPRVDVAYVQYLQLHFPLANHEDQEMFNVILLAMFNKMKEGDICINLSSLASIFEVVGSWFEANSGMQDMRIQEKNDRFLATVKRFCPHSIEQVHELLHRALAVGGVSELNAPLVFDLSRLYLRRYYNYEAGIASYIHEVQGISLDEDKKAKLKQAISLLFPPSAEIQGVNWQEVAALMSTTSNFTVISGGPGTGKTTTVLRILLLLLCLDENNRSIALCAPTGKAAARMGESITMQLKNPQTLNNIESLAEIFGLRADELRSFIPNTAVTVQRLLKVVPNHATPIFNADNKLNYDVLVVDEVSMLDLALFYKLISATDHHCKVILLGDKDQLSSVEAGAVLAELCSRLNSTDPNRISKETLNFICEMSGYKAEDILSGKIAEHVALLQFSYRSKDVPEIGILASKVNQGADFEPLSEEDLQNTFPVNRSRSLRDTLKQGDIYDYIDELRRRESEAILQSFNLGVSADNPANATDAADAARVAQATSALAPNSMHLVSDIERQRKLQAQQQYDSIIELFNEAFKKVKAGMGSNANFDLSLRTAPSVDTYTKEQLSFLAFKPAIAFLPINGEISIEVQRTQIAYRVIAPGVSDNYSPFLSRLKQDKFVVSNDSKQLEEIFRLMDRFRLLCSNNSGVLGNASLNRKISEMVKANYLKEYGYFGENDFFPGQIIIITKNDPVLGLVNGDVGFCAYAQSDAENADTAQGKGQGTTGAQPQNSNRVLRVFIPNGVEEVNGQTVTKVNVISTLFLTNYDTGFAMSIHKSQGSEYDKVTIVLAEKINRVLSKELVYTGITRAKKCVELISSKQSMIYAISQARDREGALSLRLEVQPPQKPKSAEASAAPASASASVEATQQVAASPEAEYQVEAKVETESAPAPKKPRATRSRAKAKPAAETKAEAEEVEAKAVAEAEAPAPAVAENKAPAKKPRAPRKPRTTKAKATTTTTESGE